MTSDRIKEIQQNTAYPNSVSVKQALLQVWNECEQERTNQFKSPPIVETDKLREEFKASFGKGSDKEKMISMMPTDLVFNFFLPHLSVSKEVEVSDEEISKHTETLMKTNYPPYIGGFEDGAKWMRDRQGIAPCKEVEEKCIEFCNCAAPIKSASDNSICKKCKNKLNLKEGGTK